MELLITSIALGYVAYSASTFTMPKSFKKGFKQLLTCTKCVTFWGVLIGSGCLEMALLSSLTVLLLESYLVVKL